MRKIITEMGSDAGPIFVFEEDFLTGLIKPGTEAEECYSVEEAKKAHNKLVDSWPKILSFEEIEKAVEKAEIGIPEKEKTFRDSIKVSIAGIS